jgi:hypothetical protein
LSNGTQLCRVAEAVCVKLGVIFLDELLLNDVYARAREWHMAFVQDDKPSINEARKKF